ncbi:hypothetical protein Vau01_002150 [Virgisporangium aurantiacum]|uniref:Uncharacterized protein n=1 Tax=Virgisporangium aurantiacum TaxID=175570 RepID=A0A8J3YVJ3_9ACTN|nr:hypothetical protein Vau01_002150 [Virgisporangium aurantiacum]
MEKTSTEKGSAAFGAAGADRAGAAVRAAATTVPTIASNKLTAAWTNLLRRCADTRAPRRKGWCAHAGSPKTDLGVRKVTEQSSGEPK